MMPLRRLCRWLTPLAVLALSTAAARAQDETGPSHRAAGPRLLPRLPVHRAGAGGRLHAHPQVVAMPAWIDDELNDRRRRGLYRTRRRMQSAQGVRVRRRRPGARQLLFQRLPRPGRRPAPGPRGGPRGPALRLRRGGVAAGVGLPAAAARPGARPRRLGGDRGGAGLRQRLRGQPGGGHGPGRAATTPSSATS